jgi:hypothetical protein
MLAGGEGIPRTEESELTWPGSIRCLGDETGQAAAGDNLRSQARDRLIARQRLTSSKDATP